MANLLTPSWEIIPELTRGPTSQQGEHHQDLKALDHDLGHLSPVDRAVSPDQALGGSASDGVDGHG